MTYLINTFSVDYKRVNKSPKTLTEAKTEAMRIFDQIKNSEKFYIRVIRDTGNLKEVMLIEHKYYLT